MVPGICVGHMIIYVKVKKLILCQLTLPSLSNTRNIDAGRMERRVKGKEEKNMNKEKDKSV